MEECAPNPYLLDHPPESVGRVLLSRAFEHYCLLQWGSFAEDILTALKPGRHEGTASAIRDATRLLGGLIARNRVRSWVRPFGGGEPSRLKAHIWEIDDFAPRFATSALDPVRPFDPHAIATHWIFVDLEDWNEVMEASASDLPRPTATIDPAFAKPDADPPPPPRKASGRLVRFREVTARTGLSRSTVYRRMDLGTFPRNVAMGGNVTAWREDELEAWIANPA